MLLSRETVRRLPVFQETLRDHGLPALVRARPRTLQVNVGRVCDLACHHCHVEAGPKRPERMDRQTADRVLELLEASPEIACVDLTGGAPELNEHFRHLVSGTRARGRHVMDRCNLTVLLVPGQEDTAEFLAANEVEIVASLPCYTADNVEAQRGRGVFGRSLEALRRLNALGYGRPGSHLALHLVYNPLGASLPPPQAELEERYRKELGELFGIEFHRLLTLTNMPIRRFARQLEREGGLEGYVRLLAEHFNPAAVPRLMCRDLVSVGYDGRLYDCDFNQMLEIDLGNRPRSLWDIERLSDLGGEPVATDSHCFGCTAGSGSSCGGALA